MVNNDHAQLYTIEGFAAALIMIITTFLVLNATSIYTAGDTHITDMQLEALGTDALTMMDTPVSSADPSPLQGIIENLNTTNRIKFTTMFMNLTNVSGTGPKHDIQFSANYTCRIYDTPEIDSIFINSSRTLTGGEHSVRATRWVLVDGTMLPSQCGSTSYNRSVLVEVLLWRD